MINRRTIFLCSTVVIVSCGPSSKVIVDPVHRLFTVVVSATQLTAASSELTATIYSGFKFAPVTVKFYGNETLLATTSMGTYINDSQAIRFKTTFNSMTKTTYRIRAIVSWGSAENQNIDSDYITYMTN
jgi:hypothetical protein